MFRAFLSIFIFFIYFVYPQSDSLFQVQEDKDSLLLQNSLNEVSLVNLYKIYKPAIIKPKFVNVLTGSLKMPSETLSHHIDAFPILTLLY